MWCGVCGVIWNVQGKCVVWCNMVCLVRGMCGTVWDITGRGIQW